MARGTKHVSKTMDAFRADGYLIGNVERRLPRMEGFPFGKTKDYMGVIDLIAFNELWTVGIQVCGADFSEHHRKLTGTKGDEHDEANLKHVLAWLESPYRRLELWGWRKVVRRNKDGSKSKQRVWAPRIRKYSFEDGALAWADE